MRTNESLLAVYRYGQALVEIGDDETLANLNRFLEENDLPSRVRYLLNRFSTALEKGWRARKQKWPQPLASAVGTLQGGSGTVLIGTDEVMLDYNLCCQIQPGIGGESRWGGNALTRSHPQGNVLGSEAFLIFADGHRSKVGIFESYSSGDMSKMRIEFHGIGAYPGTVNGLRIELGVAQFLTAALAKTAGAAAKARTVRCHGKFSNGELPLGLWSLVRRSCRSRAVYPHDPVA